MPLTTRRYGTSSSGRGRTTLRRSPTAQWLSPVNIKGVWSAGGLQVQPRPAVALNETALHQLVEAHQCNMLTATQRNEWQGLTSSTISILAT